MPRQLAVHYRILKDAFPRIDHRLVWYIASSKSDVSRSFSVESEPTLTVPDQAEWAAVVCEWYARTWNYDDTPCWSKQGHAIWDVRSGGSPSTKLTSMAASFEQYAHLESDDAGLELAVNWNAVQLPHAVPTLPGRYEANLELLDEYNTGLRLYAFSSNVQNVKVFEYIHNAVASPTWFFWQATEPSARLSDDQIEGLFGVAFHLMWCRSVDWKWVRADPQRIRDFMQALISVAVVSMQYNDDTRLIVYKKGVNPPPGQMIREGYPVQSVDSYDRPWFAGSSDCEDRSLGMMDIKWAVQQYTGRNEDVRAVLDVLRTYVLTAAVIVNMTMPATVAHYVCLLIPRDRLMSNQATMDDVLVIDTIQPSITRLATDVPASIHHGQHMERILHPNAASIDIPTALQQPSWIITKAELSRYALMRMFADMRETGDVHTFVPYDEKLQGAAFATWFRRPLTFHHMHALPDDRKRMAEHLQFRIPPSLFAQTPSVRVISETGDANPEEPVQSTLIPGKVNILNKLEHPSYLRQSSFTFDKELSTNVVQCQWHR